MIVHEYKTECGVNITFTMQFPSKIEAMSTLTSPTLIHFTLHEYSTPAQLALVQVLLKPGTEKYVIVL